MLMTDGRTPLRALCRVRTWGVLAVLILVTNATNQAADSPTIHRVTLTGFCYEYPSDVPREAYDLEDYIRAHNFTPPRFYKGGAIYQNFDGKLINLFNEVLREYDLYPSGPQEPRGPARLVLGESRITSWYTPDHYQTFVDMYPPECLSFFY